MLLFPFHASFFRSSPDWVVPGPTMKVSDRHRPAWNPVAVLDLEMSIRIGFQSVNLIGAYRPSILFPQFFGLFHAYIAWRFSGLNVPCSAPISISFPPDLYIYKWFHNYDTNFFYVSFFFSGLFFQSWLSFPRIMWHWPLRPRTYQDCSSHGLW